ncbi:hypothetical protein SAMN06298216_2713 [Spirosomataceae bacterium TFI 002]|nr:hypothetical protein SAMN06298216_2713 [Spirosomataceae bacterium TFI 002]
MILWVSLSNCSKIKVLDEPTTYITSLPLQIDSTKFQQFRKVFKTEKINEVSKNYGGLKPKYEMAIITQLLTDSITNNCLWLNHGLLPFCNNILIRNKGAFELIDTKTKFNDFFLPISDEEEALAYVSIMTETSCEYEFDIKFKYRTFVKNINKSYAIQVKNGFETLTFDYDLFGCGPHSHYSVKNFVDYNGNIRLIEKRKIYENPEEDGLCVD